MNAALSHISIVFRRELAAYFNSAIAYIFIIVFVLLNGGLYMTQFFLISRADMRPFFATLPYILAVFLPAVTMRLWAEERRGNTLELLLTFPMPTSELVIGKFLASLVFYGASLAGTLTLPIMLAVLGRPDFGTVWGSYTGAFLLGAFYLAIGIFISGLCRDQIVAFILSMIICFGLHLLGSQFLSASIDGWIPGLGSLLEQFLGCASRYDSFAKGVIDNRDVLYFVVGTVLFLTLNGFWLEGRMKPGAKKFFSTAVLISAGIFLMGNWLLADVSLGRFDLTEGKIYTISPATKEILRSLKAPVTAKFYVSPADKMPTGIKTLEQDVIDKLDELSVASSGKFKYKIFHMEAANIIEGAAKQGEESLEEQLQQKGIQPFQVQAIESDEIAVRLIYASVSLAYKEKPEEIIPRVFPNNLHELEYLITSKVYRMTLPETPKIALVAPYEEKGVDPQMQALLAQLGGQAPGGNREDNYELLPLALEYEGYEIARVQLNEKEPIPDGTKTLIVVEPLALNDRQKYEISRFLRRGGSLFLSIQNYEYRYSTEGRELSIQSIDKNPNINSLLSAWGFEVEQQTLVDEQHDVINLSGGARLGPFEVSVPVKVPIQILVTQSGMNPDISITSRLSSLFYLWGTSLKLDHEKIKSQGLKVDTLLTSSAASWNVPFQEGVISPQNLARQPESKMGPLPLAVIAQGQFADAFAGEAMPTWPKPEPETPEGPEAAKSAPEKSEAVSETRSMTPASGKMILVGASTLLQKHLVRGGGHLSFFLNSIDALTLGDQLVTIRSKQPIDRSINRISAPAKVVWRFISSLLIPIAIAVIGTFRMILRRKAKQDYLNEFALQTA